MADWRAGIRERSDLGTMAGEVIAWKTPADLERAATNRAKRYGGDEVVEAEKVRAVEKARLDARNRARYVDGPVLELALGAKLSYSFDFNAITPLEGVGSVYGVIRIVEVWGILDANAGGALLTLDANGSPRSARVPAPGDPAARPLAGDGWTLTLEPGWGLVPGGREGDWLVGRAQ